MGDFAALWPLALGLVAAGAVAGVLAGLLGVGGGIVIVPVLFHVFTALGIDENVRMHLAVGTSLATIIPTSIRSLRSHAKRGAVDFAVLRAWAPGIVLGVLVGSALARFAPGAALTAVFAVVALLIAANMTFGREDWRLGSALPGGAARHAIAGTIGTLSALMGIGGGTFGVTVMTLYGTPIHRAVATSSGLGLLISVPGAIGFMAAGWGEAALPPYSLGYVHLLGLALIVPLTILTAPLGVRFAHALPKRRLSQAFALFLVLTSLRMFADLAGL